MSQLIEKLGFCVICGQSVLNDDSYLKAREGYCHRSCVMDTSVTA